MNSKLLWKIMKQSLCRVFFNENGTQTLWFGKEETKLIDYTVIEHDRLYEFYRIVKKWLLTNNNHKIFLKLSFAKANSARVLQIWRLRI